VLRHGWLRQMPAAFSAAVLERSVLQEFEAGASIYAAGDGPGGMYGLVSGGISVAIAPGERGPYFAHFFGPGDWFGEGPAVSGRPRIVGLTVSRRTELFHLSLRAIDDILRDDPTSWRHFATLVLVKLELALGALDDLMIRDSAQRLVAVLLRLGGCRGPTPSRMPPHIIHVSQEDFAAMANVSRSTANAIVRRLEAAGQVSQSYRQIELLAPEALRALLAE